MQLFSTLQVEQRSIASFVIVRLSFSTTRDIIDLSLARVPSGRNPRLPTTPTCIAAHPVGLPIYVLPYKHQQLSSSNDPAPPCPTYQPGNP